MRNLCIALLRFETIRTTVPKAKELRRVVEPIINSGKVDNEAARRRAFAKLRDAELVTKLFEDLGPRFKDRQGGYTRILRLEDRPGDAAPMALMLLTEAPKAVEATAEAPAKKPRARKAKAEGDAAAPKRKRAAA
jgi:large subunit ribosomal protein L17